MVDEIIENENQEEEVKVTIEDVNKLKASLIKEREAHKITKEKYKKYNDIDIDKYQELIEKTKQQEINDFEERLKPIKREKETLQQQLEELKKQNTEYKNNIINANLERKINEITKGKINDKAFTDVMLRAKYQLKYNEDEQDFFDDKGYNITSWFDREKENSSWLPFSNGGRATGNLGGISTEDNPYNPKTLNFTKQAQLERENPQKALKLKELAKNIK